jgi:hypothetical protein
MSVRIANCMKVSINSEVLGLSVDVEFCVNCQESRNTHSRNEMHKQPLALAIT